MKFSMYFNPERQLLSINGYTIGPHQSEIGSGHIKFNDTQTEGYIMFLNIAPQLQKKGYGTKLLEEMEKRAKERGCNWLSVSTTSDSDPFWAKKGYHYRWYDPIHFGYRWKCLTF